VKAASCKRSSSSPKGVERIRNPSVQRDFEPVPFEVSDAFGGIPVSQMLLSEFDYDLPRERIAQRPLEKRDASRLLLLERDTERWEDRDFREFPDLLRGEELIIVNNARVLPVRLLGRRKGIHAQPAGRHSPTSREHLRSAIEVLLVRRIETDVWEALVRPGRKVPVGERVIFGEGELQAEVIRRGDFGLRQLRFLNAGNLPEILERLGHIPLPPYIKRPDDLEDRERYQTIFARRGMAAAAPTAGLHFTPAILDRLRARGIEICEITLEVGLGTFEPVRTEHIEDHHIHPESYEIPESTAKAMERARRDGRAILAVGTTVVRALEDAAEKSAARKSPALVEPGRAEAGIFIYPGHPFRAVDQMLTNFHLPKSSLLVMAAAFAGKELLLRAYRHAVEQNYRFYSYGDCMLIRGEAKRQD
jgi:S-adenosylmethionine:tRNA ribosyltransferase-isomerase